MQRWITGVLALLAAAACLSAAEVKFVAKPAAVADGTKVKITFELSAPTDVAVGIVNEKGVVVKHLAGGMLGEKAPKPLARGKLVQTLYWDRTDDLGKPVPAGKYTVQVQAGMKPTFERIIGRQPKALSDIGGLTVGPGGELYVIGWAGIWKESYKPAREIVVFSREFKYLRTILPYPGDLPYDRIKGVRPVKLADGAYVPRLYYAPGHRNYPGLSGRPPRQNMLVTPGGDLLFFSTVGHSPIQMVRIRAADGAIPEPFEMLKFPVKGGYAFGWPQLALSKDGKYVYAGGFITEDHAKKKDAGLLNHAVYRWKLGSKDAPEVFAGEPLKAGGGKDLFNQVHGVAVDGEGNVLVSDFGNDRVVVLSSTGKHIGEFKVEWPDHLCVDRKRGTIYVVCVDKSNKDRGGGRILWRKKKLVKIKSWKDPKVLGEIPLQPRRGAHYAKPVIALDEEADSPILWIGGGANGSISRIVDKDPGGKLPDAEPMGAGSLFPKSQVSVEHLAVDPVTERLYVREFYKGYVAGGWRAYDGATGEPVKLAGKLDGADLQVSLDGHIYTYKTSFNWRKFKRGGAWIVRWDRDGNPVPFEGSDSNVSQPMPHDDKEIKARFVDREGVHGFGLSRSGEVYVIYSSKDRTSNPMWMCVVGRDGKVKKEKLLGLTPACCSPRVDRDGNIYVLDNAIPKGMSAAPPDFAEALKERYNCYHGLFGSVIKFPPAGGGVYHTTIRIRGGKRVSRAPEKPLGERVECDSGTGPCVVDNAVWIKPYASPTPGQRVCICFPARMSLDRYGRIFVPVAPARRIRVLDTEGNEICVFGRYGNADNGGPSSSRPMKGVPMDWVYNVAASDRAVYLADTNNRRVVKVRLDYAAAAKCPAP